MTLPYPHDPRYLIALLPGLEIAKQDIDREIEQIRALVAGVEPTLAKKSKPRTDHMAVGEDTPRPKKKRKADTRVKGANTEFIVSQLQEHGALSPTTLSAIAARNKFGKLGNQTNIGNALKRAMITGHVIRLRDGVYGLSAREADAAENTPGGVSTASEPEAKPAPATRWLGCLGTPVSQPDQAPHGYHGKRCA